MGIARGYQDRECAECPHPSGTLAGFGIEGVSAPTPQTEIVPRVEFSNLQDLGRNVWNVTNKNAVHEQDASTTWVMADLGSKLTLANIGSTLQGNGSVAELVGVFFADNDQRFAMHTLSDHAAIATNAETMVKGVLSDKSRVEFEGLIRVRPKAQQTASFLSDHTLLLSKECRAESIPIPAS